ncbi:MAG TPA: hypothetical protein VLW85_13360 [Myxococcales bacterium]|nr:hypothetical protein [Myxococcales bacterium]
MTAAALVTLAACSSKPKTGNAKVSVSFSNPALIADVSHIELDISGGTPSMTPISATLTKAPNGIQWTGSITGIPAGTGRVFHAAAYKTSDASQLIYDGSTPATITAGGTATVVLILQEQNVPLGPTNFAPVITAISSSDSIVPQGSTITVSFKAHDPDGNYPLAYQWASTCSPSSGGNGSFDLASGSLAAPVAPATDVGATAHWTAGTVNGVLCTLSLKVTDSNTTQGPASVQTFFTITVDQTTGTANVSAFPNSAPIVSTLRGDFVYNFDATANTPVGGVGQIGNLFTTAIDPDGDDIRYGYAVACAGSDATSHLTPSIMGPVATDTAFNPTWAFNDPAASCVFTVTVHDLCTNGNCGATGAQGALPNGSDRGGITTGVLNATAPAKPDKAPFITRTVAPNTNGPTGQTIIDPSTDYTFDVEATDPEGGTLAAVWTPSTGSFSGPSNAGNLKSTVVYHSPATLLPVMTLSAAVTSSVSHLTTVVNFALVASDPCVGQTDGTSCSTGNLCVTGESCTAGHCGGGTPVTCSGAGQCQNNVCNPNTGCGIADKTNGTLCDDGNACTGVSGNQDSCQAGACVGGGTVTCAAPAQCFDQAACVPATGCPAPTPSSAGTACVGTNLCFQAYACDGTGTCAGSNPVNCTSTQCTTGGTCNPGTGTCQGGSNQPDGTSCNADNNNCTVNDSCQGGTCVAGSPFCAAGQSCTNGTPPVCVATVPAPQVVRDLQISPPAGVAIDPAGNTYTAAAIFSTSAISFDGHPVASLGGGDIFVARYNPAGAADWAVSYGDAANDQLGTGVAVTADGTLAVLGNFSGAFTVGTGSLNSSAQIDFLAALRSSDGTGKWAKQFNDGANGVLLSIAASPTSSANRIAVCGKASAAATDLVPGATFAGSSDLVIAVFDSSGAFKWGTQLGATSNQECDAVAVDDNGDVYAAGKFDSASLTFPGSSPITLTGPGTTARKYVWVAKFAGAGNGSGGASTLAATAFTDTGNGTPLSLAADASGKLVVAGNFTGTLTVGASPLATAGGLDAWVAKLDPAASFNPVWSFRLGGAGSDAANSVAVDSFGDVIVTGGFQRTTTGLAALTANGTSASDVFVLKVNGATGAQDFAAPTAANKTTDAALYGDAATQTGDAVAVNRAGAGAVKDRISIAGTLNSTIDFPSPAGPVTATGVTDTFLLFSTLQ